MNTGQSTVNTSTSVIVPANPNRAACLVSSGTAFFVGSVGMTATTGLLVPAGVIVPIESTGAIYGVTGTGSAVVTFADQSFGGGGIF